MKIEQAPDLREAYPSPRRILQRSPPSEKRLFLLKAKELAYRKSGVCLIDGYEGSFLSMAVVKEANDPPNWDCLGMERAKP